MRHSRRSLLGLLALAAMSLLLVTGSTSPAQAAGRIHGGKVHVTGRAHPARQASRTMQADQVNLLITFYGFIDNSPPGTQISYPQIHDGAGGTGTFDDPITFATDKDEFAPGTVIYVPFLQKYFIMEDGCVECSQDFQNGKLHIDLWTGGQADSGDALIQCENSLTRDNGTIIVNPDPGLDVDTTPLFDSDTGACFTP